MASMLDRLLGRSEPQAKAALTVVPDIEAKASSGPGAYAMTWYPQLTSLSQNPNRLMNEAMALYHGNLWVNAAERALGDRFVRMDWHLEDEQGETVTDESDEALRAVLRLLERPSKTRTRRQLWSLTFRHTGLAGNAIWYLDQRDAFAGTPLQLQYINPVRMTPVNNTDGVLTGWVLDHPENPVSGGEGRAPVPFTPDEIIHFTLSEPDWGTWGIGVAEAAQRKILLDRLTDTHASGVLASGGRLTGLITPKPEATVTDDQWQQFVRDWRRITDDPDAAKRLQIAKMPLDFTQMTASPKELQLVDVGKQNRDDILAAWGVPPTQIGIVAAAGLNSGERGHYEAATMWETVKGRSEAIREKIQYELLDRFQALGINLQLVFEYPEFDDKVEQYENATKARYIPITNDERRAIVGLDPLEDLDLGTQIYVASDLVRVDEEPEPAPAPLLLPPAVPAAETEPIEDMGKAKVVDATRLRARAEKRYLGRVQKAMSAVLSAQRSDVLKAVKRSYGHLTAKAKDSNPWWNAKREDSRLSSALLPLLEEMTAEVAQNVRATFPAKADANLERILAIVKDNAGKRITEINDTTREAVAALIEQGVEDGLSIQDLSALIEDATPFDAVRAELVSRTETMLAYNEGALHTYREFDVEQVQAIDGDKDDECAARDGSVYSLDDALNITDHPNGTLDWMPIAKAQVEKPQPVTNVTMPAMTFAMPEQAPPVVNFTPPEIHVAAPEVYVDNRDVAKALVELRSFMAKPKNRRIERDENGRIIGVVEE